MTIDDLLGDAAGYVLEPRAQFDRCIVGLVERFDHEFVLYDRQCVVGALAADLSPDDDEDADADRAAEEWFSVNILGSWLGDGTPGFLTRPSPAPP